MLTDIAIAQAAKPKPIRDVAAELELSEDDLELYGRYKGKVHLEAINRRGGSKGRLVLVTGISPTPAGEGKSTLSVGMADALRKRSQKVVLCLREPSLGPVFGVKGGATGGGYAQVIPMEDINLHFTGDFHAITAAHALLSAMLDNHLQQGNALNIDVRRITWKRCVDMNDRALRNITIGLGGPANGMPRQDGFLITAASEVMAVFALAKDPVDLEARLGRIVLGYDRNQRPVRAADINAHGAMTLLLKDALAPNLVQTLEGTPAFIHAGPFGNIAHGCNSLIATGAGLSFGDIVITEAGFGADLGAEKFLDIKCKGAGLAPDVAIIVATIRALKMHGGVAQAELALENAEAVKRGFSNLEKHIENMRKYGLPVIVALNRFATDSAGEIDALLCACRDMGVKASLADVHAKGGEGALELADMLLDTLHNENASFKPLYSRKLGLAEKVETVAREIYGADGVDFSQGAQKDIARLESIGMKEALVCIAKTQYSFSDDPTKRGRPRGFRISVREVTPSGGAGFVVVHTGDIMTMPGLPKKPAAENMKVHADGTIEGLF
jgi:formate--tetrahydrofolate ligase